MCIRDRVSTQSTGLLLFEMFLARRTFFSVATSVGSKGVLPAVPESTLFLNKDAPPQPFIHVEPAVQVFQIPNSMSNPFSGQTLLETTTSLNSGQADLQYFDNGLNH
eukprot:TRINITY_DN192_c0_g2_i1.p1 TRINITY_DN192_c0_g2~~TRINITY_DN192_c0_g2_i1.p1  ORF type:complete len:107 (-),score=28.79 TRINITY_DN192_c0_g2_i1:89-409(-)